MSLRMDELIEKGVPAIVQSNVDGSKKAGRGFARELTMNAAR
jgi:hypothetical protein